MLACTPDTDIAMAIGREARKSSLAVRQDDEGGKRWAEAEADAELAAANASLADIDLPADVRAELTAIAEFITARTW